MALTPAQLVVLKADILADPLLAAHPNNADGNLAISQAYALTASPAYTVWKLSVSLLEVGDNLNGAELAGLSSLNHTRLLTVINLSAQGVNPSKADRRAFFDDIFSGAGGTVTRANLLNLWRRLANRAERLFATGTGTPASPGTLTFEGILSPDEIQAARNLP